MKRLAGVCCLVVALGFLYAAWIGWDVDDAKNAGLVEAFAQAIGRENAMSSLRTRIAMDHVTVAEAIVRHSDGNAANAALAKDEAELDQVQDVDRRAGSAAALRRSLVEVSAHRQTLYTRVGVGVVLLLAALVLIAG